MAEEEEEGAARKALRARLRALRSWVRLRPFPGGTGRWVVEESGAGGAVVEEVEAMPFVRATGLAAAAAGVAPSSESSKESESSEDEDEDEESEDEDEDLPAVLVAVVRRARFAGGSWGAGGVWETGPGWLLVVPCTSGPSSSELSELSESEESESVSWGGLAATGAAGGFGRGAEGRGGGKSVGRERGRDAGVESLALQVHGRGQLNGMRCRGRKDEGALEDVVSLQ